MLQHFINNFSQKDVGDVARVGVVPGDSELELQAGGRGGDGELRRLPLQV